MAAHGFQPGDGRGVPGGVRARAGAADGGPGQSHRGPLHSMYDAQGRWVLRIPDHEIDTERVTALTGGAGSLVLLNCRTIHGSAPNRSGRSRPLLLIVYSSADSWPYTANPIPSPLSGHVVRGERAVGLGRSPGTRGVPRLVGGLQRPVGTPGAVAPGTGRAGGRETWRRAAGRSW